MREPFPNELVRLAWKARVGYSWDKRATQRFWSKIEWKQRFYFSSYNEETEKKNKVRNRKEKDEHVVYFLP